MEKTDFLKKPEQESRLLFISVLALTTLFFLSNYGCSRKVYNEYNVCLTNNEKKTNFMMKRRITDQFAYEVLPPTGSTTKTETETKTETGDTISLLNNMPYLLSSKMIPSETIINEILSNGIHDAGMSGGVKWQPYILDNNQFIELINSLKQIDPNLEYVEPANWVKTLSDWQIWLQHYRDGVPWEKNKKLTDEYNCIIKKMNAAYDSGDKEKGEKLHWQSVKVGTELAEFVMENTNKP